LCFGDKDWRHQLNKVARDYKFHATLKPKLDNAIEDWHKTQPAAVLPPIISSDELRITAPWATDDEPSSNHP